MLSSRARTWAPVIISLILILPLFPLPLPNNVSSIPWKVELLFSLFLIAALAFRTGHIHVVSGLRWLISDRTLAAVFISMGLFCAWSAVSGFWSISPTSSVHHTLVWANYLLILAVAIFIAKGPAGKAFIISIFCLLALFIGGLATFDFLTIQDFAVQEGTLRIRYAKFAEMLVLIAPVLFAVATETKTRAKSIILLGLGAVAWIGVMLSLSKGAFLSGSIGFVLLFITLAIFNRRSIRKVSTAAASWIILTAIFQIGIAEITSIPTTVNYISGEHAVGGSTSDMRLYTWKVAREMIVSNLLLGVGADNFGIAFNEAREAFAKANPTDPNSAIGEDYIFERAHNEPIQIFSELGIFGIAIFVIFVGALTALSIRTVYQRGRHLSPLFYGSIAGLAAFAASSLVSSFSFRAFQNGNVFFLVLGITVSATLRRRNDFSKEGRSLRAAKWIRAGIAAIPALLIVFSFTKGISQYVLLAGERSKDLETAVKYFNVAAKLDPDNPGAELAAAEAFVREKQWAEAIPYFRGAIDGGLGVTVIHSYQANAQEMSGNLDGAEKTLREAASVYPRSCFIRARLALILEKLGNYAEAEEQLSIGRAVNLRQTNGWYSVIKDGILNAHLKSQSDPNRFAAPPELVPYNAIHAYNTEKVRVD